MHGYDQDTIGQLQKYPLGGPHAIIFFKWSRMLVKVPTDPAEYAYQGCVTFGCASHIILIKGITLRPYEFVASKYLCVIPSLL